MPARSTRAALGATLVIGGMAFTSFSPQGGEAAPGRIGPDPASDARTSDAGADGFTVEIRFTGSVLSLAAGAAGPCLAWPGLATAGAPRIDPNVSGWLVALPAPGASAIELLADDVDSLPATSLCGPQEPDGLAEAAGTLPRNGVTGVTLEDVGWLRDQPVARLAVRRVVRDGDGLVAERRRLRLRVHFPPSTTLDDAPSARTPDPVFDHIGRSALLNGPVPVRPEALAARQAPRRAPESAADDAASDDTALKIVVDRDGPVVVDGAALAAAGWDLATVDPAAISLEAGGRPQAIDVELGPAGQLGPASRLVFPGRAMTGEYTRGNVYWLRREGEAARFGVRAAAPSGSAGAAPPFTQTLRFERDDLYVLALHDREVDDRWMWGPALSAPAVREERFSLSGLAPLGRPARLRVRLLGITDDRRVAPDHHARLGLNGVALAGGRFEGRGPWSVEAEVPPGVLRAGENRLALATVGDTGASVDQVHLDAFELDVPAPYLALADRIELAGPATGRFEFAIDGFTTPDVQVLDVTSAAAPERLTGVEVTSDGAGGHRAAFEADARPGRRYLAFATGGTSPPAAVVANRASDWRSPDHGADYVIVAHRAFAGAVAPLAAHRAASGLRVATVLVEDVYDEFSHGVFDPRAIRDFLRHAAARWRRPAPTYVLLAGEANLDYRGGYGAGPPNFVPSMQVELDEAEPAGVATSDAWFAALDEADLLPDVLVGRLSVATAAEAEVAVDKIIRYDAAAADAPWRRRAILVADDDGAADFEPARFPVDGDLSGAIRGAIEDGALVLSFVGHGNVDLWSPWPGGGRILQNTDLAALAPHDGPPLLTTATCMSGWFAHPLKPVSMAELWVTSPGGGIAAYSPTGLADLRAQTALLEPFYAGLGGPDPAPLGALAAGAVARALASGGGLGDVVRMFALLGDPATVVWAGEMSPEPSATPTRAAPTLTPGSAVAPDRRLYLPSLSAGGAFGPAGGARYP